MSWICCDCDILWLSSENFCTRRHDRTVETLTMKACSIGQHDFIYAPPRALIEIRSAFQAPTEFLQTPQSTSKTVIPDSTPLETPSSDYCHVRFIRHSRFGILIGVFNAAVIQGGERV